MEGIFITLAKGLNDINISNILHRKKLNKNHHLILKTYERQ
jgi:hypothetical protein